jgi:hypothetical protein
VGYLEPISPIGLAEGKTLIHISKLYGQNPSSSIRLYVKAIKFAGFFPPFPSMLTYFSTAENDI